MQYFVKIHILTGLIEGYIENESLNKLQSAYKNQSEEVFGFSLVEGSRYDSDRNYITISPTQIIAIEAKYIR